MLIILEGCDGVGKSHVARQLADALSTDGSVEVLHKGPMAADAITEYEHPLESYVPGAGRHIICDRWAVGELIYGPLLRGSSRMKEHERRHIDKFLAARGAVIVHMTAPKDLILRRLGERGDDLIDASQVAEITDAYFRVATELGWTTELVDAIMTGDSVKDVDTIIGLMLYGRRAETRASHLAAFSTYIGPCSPSYLLLGERRNERKSAGQRSAFVPLPGTSSGFLLNALPVDVSNTCGIANACEENIVDLWETLNRPLIVALGRAAERECEIAELPHGTVPHPQAVRRFHHAESAEYGRAIREAGLHRRDMTFAFSHQGS